LQPLQLQSLMEMMMNEWPELKLAYITKMNGVVISPKIFVVPIQDQEWSIMQKLLLVNSGKHFSEIDPNQKTLTDMTFGPDVARDGQSMVLRDATNLIGEISISAQVMEHQPRIYKEAVQFPSPAVISLKN